jgi:hypothetical protein
MSARSLDRRVLILLAIGAVLVVAYSIIRGATGTSDFKNPYRVARIFWETGKYATTGLLMLALIRFRPGWRTAILPALYLVLLVPGAVMAIDHFGLADAREPLSFNLSGPLAIAISVLFFSQLRVSLEVLRLLMWPVVLPIVAMATAVLIGIVEAGPIHFTGEANLATSGGFGPNQVSAVLGFGVYGLAHANAGALGEAVRRGLLCL